MLTTRPFRDRICPVPSGTYALVAQLDRVTDYESVGRGFESLPSHQDHETKSRGLFVFRKKKPSRWKGREQPGSAVQSGGQKRPGGAFFRARERGPFHRTKTACVEIHRLFLFCRNFAMEGTRTARVRRTVRRTKTPRRGVFQGAGEGPGPSHQRGCCKIESRSVDKIFDLILLKF